VTAPTSLPAKKFKILSNKLGRNLVLAVHLTMVPVRIEVDALCHALWVSVRICQVTLADWTPLAIGGDRSGCGDSAGGGGPSGTKTRCAEIIDEVVMLHLSWGSVLEVGVGEPVRNALF
jgi:hypothetical protein